MNRSDSPCSGSGQERRVRGMGLVRLSFLFAFFLVIPIEISAMNTFWSMRAILPALLVKGTCLTLILLPLVIYVVLNGLAALKHVWGRVTFIAVLVLIDLIHAVQMLVGKH